MDQFNFTCKSCGASFKSKKAMQQHRIDAHQPHRRKHAKDRPRDRGAIPCGICTMTFTSNEAVTQHRRDKHGVDL